MIVAAVVDDKMDIGMKPVLNEGNETDNVINTILNNFLN